MTITVIVDDNDPAIVYGGAWTALHPSALGIKGINETVGNTLHNTSIGDTTSQESFFSFNFSGTAVSVFAMVMSTNGMELTGPPYPWKCIIDQQPTAPLLITGVDIPTTIQLCQAAELPDGIHLLNFTFSIPTGSGNISSVFLDYIEYLPSTSATPRTFEFTAVSFDDASVSFGEEAPIGNGFLSQGWTTIPALSDGTTGLSIPALEPNYTVNIDIQFSGTSLTWIGFTDPGLSASGTYIIDNPEITFQIEIPAANNKLLQPGRVYFQTPLLDKGQHNIEVVYTGSAALHQLSIQKVIVGNGTVPANSSAAATPSGTSSVQTASSTRPAPHRPVPAIVGVIAGVSVVAFIIVLAIIRKRHRQRRAQHPPIIQPFNSQPASFIARLLTHPSVAALDIKGRRRLLPPVEEPTHPGIIPPSKLATRRVSAAAAESPEPTPEPIPVADVDDEGRNADVPPVRRARTRGIQEEDSGLRMVEQLREEEESIIVVMPPAYTAD